MWEIQVKIDGEWQSIRPPKDGPCTPPPYRYQYEKDAREMLAKLHPKTNPDDLRVERV